MEVKVFEAIPMLVEVNCNHPDYSSRNYTFAVEDNGEWGLVETAEWNAELRRVIEERVNKYHFWHEVEITLVWHINGKEYRKEI